MNRAELDELHAERVVHAEPFGEFGRCLAGRRRIVALALQQVGAVDAGGDDAHQHLVGVDPRGGDLGDGQDLGAAERRQGDGLHASTV